MSSLPPDIATNERAGLRLLSQAVTSLHLALGQCATLLQIAAGILTVGKFEPDTF